MARRGLRAAVLVSAAQSRPASSGRALSVLPAPKMGSILCQHRQQFLPLEHYPSMAIQLGIQDGADDSHIRRRTFVAFERDGSTGGAHGAVEGYS